MRDGDIFRWRWRDEARDGEQYAYHCRSRIAVCRDGRLMDTFWGWSTNGAGRRLREEEIELTHVGNEHEWTRITEWQIPYHAPEDVEDLRHSNDSRAPIFLRPGAARSADAMRRQAQDRLAEAHRMVRAHQQLAMRMEEMLDLIEEGRLEEVML